jgi:hypothetical protein
MLRKAATVAAENPPRRTAIFVNIVTEYQSFLDASDDDVVEHAFGIETGMTGHDRSYQTEDKCVNSYLLIYGRPCAATLPRPGVNPLIRKVDSLHALREAPALSLHRLSFSLSRIRVKVAYGK